MVPHLDPDRLVLLALAVEQPADGELEHIAACSDCAMELDQLRAVAAVGRETQPVRDLPPAPEHVWTAIAAQTVSAPPDAQPSQPAQRARPTRRIAWGGRIAGWKAAVLAAAALVVGVVGTILVVREPPPQVLAVASLTVLDPAAAGATGKAELLEGRRLRVTIDGMPTPEGYYEVWLYDGADRMIGLGDVGPGSTVVSVPASADPAVFAVVDISAQRLGQQEHGQSMLQGKLVPATDSG